MKRHAPNAVAVRSATPGGAVVPSAPRKPAGKTRAARRPLVASSGTPAHLVAQATSDAVERKQALAPRKVLASQRTWWIDTVGSEECPHGVGHPTWCGTCLHGVVKRGQPGKPLPMWLLRKLGLVADKPAPLRASQLAQATATDKRIFDASGSRESVKAESSAPRAPRRRASGTTFTWTAPSDIFASKRK